MYLVVRFLPLVVDHNHGYEHWRQSGINSAGARRGFSGILLQNTYKYTNLKQIPGDGRKVVVQVHHLHPLVWRLCQYRTSWYSSATTSHWLDLWCLAVCLVEPAVQPMVKEKAFSTVR